VRERCSWRAGLVALALALAVGLSRTSTFTWPSRLAVGGVEATAAALVVRSWKRRRREGSTSLPFARLAAWTVLATAGLAWELDELFGSPRSAYPTASSLIEAAMASSPWAKAAVVATWLALGLVVAW
jgi:hypothetical protein